MLRIRRVAEFNATSEYVACGKGPHDLVGNGVAFRQKPIGSRIVVPPLDHDARVIVMKKDMLYGIKAMKATGKGVKDWMRFDWLLAEDKCKDLFEAAG